MSDYVLNSSSLKPLYPDRATAIPHLAQLLQGLAALDSNAEDLPSFRLPDDPWAIPMVQDQLEGREVSLGEIAHAFYDTVNHDYAVFFDGLNRTVPSDRGLSDPLIDELLLLEPEKPAVGYEATFPGVVAAGYDSTLCALTDSILVSLFRGESWNFSQMGFVAGTSTFLFDHLAMASHADEINGRHIEVVRAGLSSRNFWDSRATAFPNLDFGVDVETQLGKFSATVLPLLFRRLAELDAKVGQWKNSKLKELPTSPPPLFPESKATMDRFKNDRSFRGSDGIPRIFEQHVWVDRGHRIHVFVHQDPKRFEIGYIGYHLPISSKPT